MTREEAREFLTNISYDLGTMRMEYLSCNDGEKMREAIKTLVEQEPIRAEIESTRKMYLDMNDIDWLNGCDYVLSVIDKYKAESEG